MFLSCNCCYFYHCSSQTDSVSAALLPVVVQWRNNAWVNGQLLIATGGSAMTKSVIMTQALTAAAVSTTHVTWHVQTYFFFSVTHMTVTKETERRQRHSFSFSSSVFSFRAHTNSPSKCPLWPPQPKAELPTVKLTTLPFLKRKENEWWWSTLHYSNIIKSIWMVRCKFVVLKKEKQTRKVKLLFWFIFFRKYVRQYFSLLHAFGPPCNQLLVINISAWLSVSHFCCQYYII